MLPFYFALNRCKWLSTLYEIKNQLSTLTSLEKVQQYQNKLKYIQTSPLNKQLQAELNKLETTLIADEKSEKEQLEEALFNEGYSSFVNLGVKGRAYILEKTLENDGKISTAKTLTESLEERVVNAKDLTSTKELLDELSALPLANYSLLTDENRVQIIESLLDEKGWTNLFSLDQAIRRKVQEKAVKNEPVTKNEANITDTFTVDENFFK